MGSVSYTHLDVYKRQQATQGAFEAAVMGGLRVYAHGERLLPGALRRRQSHIVYALAG